jgi:long-chain acyl-CoA synthetase
VLATHPYVAEVAVIGMPGADGQEQVVAVLVARVGTHPTPDDLTEFLRGQLAPFKRPVVYHLVSALPRTEVGRLDRGSVQRGYALAAGLPLSRLTSVGPRGADGTSDDQQDGADPVDTAPEAVANLDELGTKLPGTGNRADRGDLDTDEDLF